MTENDQCQAATWGHTRFSQCDHPAKYDSLVQDRHLGNREGGDPYTIRMCGVHNNLAKKGGYVNIITGRDSKHWSGGPETRSVMGITSQAVIRQQEIDRASTMATNAYQFITTMADSVGREIVKYPDVLDTITASNHPRIAEAVQRYHDAVQDYEQKRAEVERVRSEDH